MAEELGGELLARAFNGDLVAPQSDDIPASGLLGTLRFPQTPRAGAGRSPSKADVERDRDESGDPVDGLVAPRFRLSSGEPAEPTLAGVLRKAGALSPEELWHRSGLDIDVFYDLLRTEEQLGLVRERHVAGDSSRRLLEAT